MSDPRMLTCEEALRFLAAYLDGELRGTGDREVEAHLARCRSCYSRAEFERQLKARVGSVARAEIRPEFGARIQRLLGRFAAPPDAGEQ